MKSKKRVKKFGLSRRKRDNDSMFEANNGKPLAKPKGGQPTLSKNIVLHKLFYMSYDPGLPADFDPIAMGVEDPPEPQEDSGDLDDDSDLYP